MFEDYEPWGWAEFAFNSATACDLAARSWRELGGSRGWAPADESRVADESTPPAPGGALATLRLHAAADGLLAMAALFADPRHLVWAHQTLARSCVVASARAHWLLDPRPPKDVRVARGFEEHRHALAEAGRKGLLGDVALRDKLEEIARSAEAWGLDVRRAEGRVNKIELGTRKTDTDAVVDLLAPLDTGTMTGNDGSAMSAGRLAQTLLSSAVHADPDHLLRANGSPADARLTDLRPSPRYVGIATAFALLGFDQSVSRYADAMGWVGAWNEPSMKLTRHVATLNRIAFGWRRDTTA